MQDESEIVAREAPILITGATGFMGPAVIQSLLIHGFSNLHAFVRPSSDMTTLKAVVERHRGEGRVEIFRGNLLSRQDCIAASKDVAVIFHLATGGDKSFPDAIMNSVVTTRNLLEGARQHKSLRRFVNVSSFAVYATGYGWVLDETSPVDGNPRAGADAYSFAKVKQDEIVSGYGIKYGIPYVIVRPGSVFGPGKTAMTGRVGIDSFGLFLHLGGSNRIPFTYIDNCADAIVLSGVIKGVEGEVFNIVDDDLPSSREFLRLYKSNVKKFASLYVPGPVSYMLCWLWEKYSQWSNGQLPPTFNRRRWRSEWKKTRYSNDKLKSRLGWRPKVSMAEGLVSYFAYCREKLHA